MIVAASDTLLTVAVAVAALGALVTAASIVVLTHTVRRGQDLLLRGTNGVQSDVTTKRMDGTVGSLASEAETRRIETISRAERTVKEQQYLDDSPLPGPPQGPGA